MLLYNKNNGDTGESLIVNNTKMTHPYPKWGLYEYVKPEITENQTLGAIEVVEDIATNKVIDFPDWKYPEKHIRITVREKWLKTGKKFSALAFDMLVDNPDSTKKNIDKKKYRTAYLSYVAVADGFTLNEDGTINSPVSELVIEQLDNNFSETTIEDDDIVIMQDNEI